VKGTKNESEREAIALYMYMHIKERANVVGKGEKKRDLGGQKKKGIKQNIMYIIVFGCYIL
jgi:hypothetical protein